MTPKQIAIEAVEEAIDFAEKQLSALRAKLDKLKDGGDVQAEDGGTHDPVPPDPTHPHG